MLEINLLDPQNFDPFMIIWSNIRASLRQLFSDEVRIKLEDTLGKWSTIVDGLSLFKKKIQKKDLSKEEESTLYSMMVLLKTVRNELVNKLRFATVSPKQEELYKQIVNKMNEICPPQTCDRKMVIGKGGNGQVIARNQERTIARKLLTSDDPRIVQAEYEIMKKYHDKASHLFVKPYSLGNYYYDMQLLKNYEGLDSLIKKKSLTEPQKISITRQLLEGLEIFRQNKSAHGDLKPANIMVKIDPSDDSVQVKIIDLGSVCDTDPCKNDAGTLVYQPPNMIIQKGESTLSQVQRYDLYAMGIILFQLFNNKTTEQLAKNTDEIRLSQQQKQKLKAQLKDKGISSIPDIFLSSPSSSSTVLSSPSSLSSSTKKLIGKITSKFKNIKVF